MKSSSRKKRFASLRNSYFLQRIMLLLLTALFLWTILTSLIYAYIARPIFIDIKKKDILPQAKFLAQAIVLDERPLLNQADALMQLSYQFFGSWTYIINTNGDIFSSQTPEGLSDQAVQAVRSQALKVHQETCREKKEVSKLITIPAYSGETLYLSVPIQADDGDIIGSVVMVQSMNELNAGFKSLYSSLFFAAILGASILLIPAVFATIHITQPLNKIREVALSMTKGDFSLRAQSLDGHNEISDLGNAINHLAEQIDLSFSQLTHERNQLREIIDSIAEGIIAVDDKLSVTNINNMVWQIFHRDPERYSADSLLTILDLKPLFEECLKTESSVSGTFQADGDIILYLITPLVDKNHVSGAVGLFRDVTESERLEQTRRDYVANVSHELRSPITAMRGLLEPLYDGLVQDPETTQRYYRILLKETVRLSNLINDMLELSRLQSGNSYVQQGPFDAEKILLDLAGLCELQASENDRQFELLLPKESLPAVWGNPDRLEQILLILFDNALKFTEPETGKVILQLIAKEDHCTISLTDNGKGIRPDDLPYVFERFYKADKAHNEVGTGLGLSIASEIAKKMGQKLSVTSAPGEGSCFSLDLPYARDILRSEAHLKDVFETGSEETRDKDSESEQNSRKEIEHDEKSQ